MSTSNYERMLGFASISFPTESKINEYYAKCKDLTENEILDMIRKLMPSKDSKMIAPFIESIKDCDPIEISDITVNKLTMIYPNLATEISGNPAASKKVVSIIDTLVKEMQQW
jgi:ribosomal protein L20A (L18A)